MLAVCMPSRGLVFSKTMEAVLLGMQEVNRVGIATKLVMSHDLPIPDCHNYIVEQALQDHAVTKILLTEEDNYIPPDAFVALATSDRDIVMLQYNDKNGSPNGIIHYNEAGQVLWGGVGAVCITRRVFESLDKPIFRTDVRYKIIREANTDGKLISKYEEIDSGQTEWDEAHARFVPKKDPYKYGGQDIYFYTTVREKGYEVFELKEYRAHHFELVQNNEFDSGGSRTNNGAHTIRTV